VILGVFIGTGFWYELYKVQEYFFAALAGIFLYLSMSSLFPILQNLIDPAQQSGRNSMKRLGLANLGFFSAMGFMLPLVRYIKKKIISQKMTSYRAIPYQCIFL